MKGTSKIGKLINNMVNFKDMHQREIMLGLTVTGVILTGITAAKAGIKAKEIMDAQKKKVEELEERLENDEINDDEFLDEKKEITVSTVKEMAPVVLPPVIIAGTTVYSAVSGYKSASKQIAAITAAFNITEKKLSEYQDKAIEMFGDKKAQTIKDGIAADKVKSEPPKDDLIIRTGHGEVLCLDDYSGRYFYSDPEHIRKCVNDVNEQLRDEFYVSLNDFYDALGLPNCKLGSDIGFCMEDGNLNVSFSFTGATLGDKDNIPCLVLNYDVSPKYGFGDMSGRFYR